MKTAISVPDDLFQLGEQLARRERRSRSEVYSTALREYVARHTPDQVTEVLNEVLAEIGRETDPFVRQAAAAVLQRDEW